jgi:hypothetical protein
MTAHPPEGPYTTWEVTREDTGEVIMEGHFPANYAAIRDGIADFRRRQAALAPFLDDLDSDPSLTGEIHD